uniref:PPIase cyclophilin-type domain-containing protein n=1 Tax=Glossina austeni TaxID=7395 RepID=A0A1A9UXJ6_GLOAU
CKIFFNFQRNFLVFFFQFLKQEFLGGTIRTNEYMRKIRNYERTMNDKERRLLYKEHRRRVQNAKSVVNSQAPKPKQSEEPRELTFFDLMKALYNRGNRRTFTSSPIHARSNTNVSKFRCLSCRRVNRTNNREKSNLSLMVNFSSHTSEKVPKKADTHSSRKRNPYAIPQHVLQRYDHLQFLDTSLLRKLLRPKIFLDLEVREERPLGRVIIQLFTEACPEIVMQFVRMCSMGNPNRFHFTRLFPPLWLEGELLLDDSNALTIPNIEHDPNAINHGSAAGILSFPSRYLRGSKYRFISFTPADVLNGKRIAFGRIRRGQNVLDILQGFDVTRNGRPVKDVVVTSCGLLIAMDLKSGTLLMPPTVTNSSCSHPRYTAHNFIQQVGIVETIEAALILSLTLGVIGANSLVICVINNTRYSTHIHQQFIASFTPLLAIRRDILPNTEEEEEEEEEEEDLNI